MIWNWILTQEKWFISKHLCLSLMKTEEKIPLWQNCPREKKQMLSKLEHKSSLKVSVW